MIQSPTFPVCSKTNKHEHRNNICLRCLESFYTKESFAKHQRIFTRKDFRSAVHVLPAAENEQANIKFKQVRNTYRAPCVIYADFGLSIL